MGEHRKPDPPLSGGTPPPDNSDSQVPPPEPGSGVHRKSDNEEDQD